MLPLQSYSVCLSACLHVYLYMQYYTDVHSYYVQHEHMRITLSCNVPGTCNSYSSNSPLLRNFILTGIELFGTDYKYNII